VAELRAELNDKLALINSAGDDSAKLEGVIRQKAEQNRVRSGLTQLLLE
jgi:hypothetical protein